MRKEIEHALTDVQIAQLRALEGRPPDTEDVPEAAQESWRQARRGDCFRPHKEAISLRLDRDVLAWLRSHGPGYQRLLSNYLAY